MGTRTYTAGGTSVKLRGGAGRWVTGDGHVITRIETCLSGYQRIGWAITWPGMNHPDEVRSTLAAAVRATLTTKGDRWPS